MLNIGISGNEYSGRAAGNGHSKGKGCSGRREESMPTCILPQMIMWGKEMLELRSWLKSRLLSFMTFVIGIMVIKRIVMSLDIDHAVKPKGELARLLWISEAARVPIIIGFVIILSPINLFFKVKDKIAQNRHIEQ